MFTKSIVFENFKKKKIDSRVKENLKKVLKDKNEVIRSLKSSYKNSYSKQILNKYKKYRNINIIGMGGSILGSRAIYNFLEKNIKKNFSFTDNLKIKITEKSKKKD